MSARPWSADELATLARDYPEMSTATIAQQLGRSLCAVYGQASHLGLKKSEQYRASPAACRLRRGDAIGAEYRFQPGQVPHNKGMRHPPGWAPGRMAERQFKPGNLSGRAAQLRAPVGTVVIQINGYHKVKVRAETQGVRSHHNWELVHVRLWEQHHGPIPPGHAVGFRNGNKADIRIDNLELLSRAELMRRNTVHRYPPELKHTLRALGKLKTAIQKTARANP